MIDDDTYMLPRRGTHLSGNIWLCDSCPRRVRAAALDSVSSPASMARAAAAAPRRTAREHAGRPGDA